MTHSAARILVVDDEQSVLLTVQEILRHEGYDVDAVPDGASAIRAVRAHRYDLVLTDLKMPGVDGLAVLAEVRDRSPNTVTVMMTGYGSVDSALEALQLGAYEYLLKPAEVAELKAAVRRALERKRLSEIDTLYRVSGAIASFKDAQAIADEIADAARRVLSLANARLVSLLPEPSLAADDRLREPLADAELQARLRTGDIITHEDHVSGIETWARSHDLAAFAFVPGLTGDGLICVLFADNASQDYDFHASAQRFLYALSSQAALALENAALISELKRNNAQLAAANQKLRQLDDLKSQFLSVATHELRTPLSVILGYNAMLAETLDDRLNEEERETLRESVAACRRLIRLVNSMLDISQIEAGRMRMNFTHADVADVLRSVTALFHHEARTRGIELQLKTAVLPRLNVDVERIEQALVNLIGNALKFTPAGGQVTVSASYVPGTKAVEVGVSDTGPGIAPQDQERIFDEFTEVRRRHPQSKGSGLGLAITRRIVQAHGGNLRVTSKPGQGSTFTFSLPIKGAHNRGSATARKAS